ncbi:MAG TPA: hypothetical protein VI913_04715, partial [Candidatus Peribacteraceae bacterium]|nr:hypothetical protein [Candidatus Peribacteraceae bacterium]
MAKAFALRFITNMIMGLLQKLETLHVIKNVMYYADALSFNQYIGNKLNKFIDKPTDPTQVRDTEADTNVAGIIGAFSVLPIGSQIMSPQQLETIATGGQLTPQQESTIVKGALAMLTSAGGCRGTNRTAIQNVSTYLAAKNAGVSASSIVPGSPSFYEQMTRLADPFSSPAFRELTLEDTAQQVEAEADAAANQELTSSGQKTGKSPLDNTILAGVGNIQERVSSLLDNMLGATVESSSSGFASSIGRILGDFVTTAILRNDIRVTAEQGTCGVPVTSPAPLPPLPLPPGGGTFDVTLTVNGTNSTVIRRGESATLSWNVVEPTGNVTISNLPASCSPPGLSGTCQVSPTNDTTYTISVDGQTVGQASIAVISGFVESASISASPQLLPAGGGTTVVSWNIVGSGIRATLNGSSVGLSGSQSFLLTTSGRTFILDIFDSQTGEVLDTQSVSVNIQF